jgi:hypothetical protein
LPLPVALTDEVIHEDEPLPVGGKKSLLSVAVDAPVTLLRSIRIPRDLVMDQPVAVVLKVQAFGGGPVTAASFDFQANPPTVKVEAESEKAGRGATLPLHPFVAGKVASWLTRRGQASTKLSIKPPVESLGPGTWSTRAAEMFRRDLDEARSIWLAEVENLTDEHQRRTESRFLKPENDRGKVADFHALRHTFISMLASSGVHPKVAQQLARHSTITLTMDRYSRTRLVDLNASIGNLPTLATVQKPNLAVSRAEATSHISEGAQVLVARLVARPADASGEALMTVDESSRKSGPVAETQTPLKTRGFANDCSPLMTADVSGNRRDSNPEPKDYESAEVG